MKLRTLDDQDFSGKTVLVRLDLNVPLAAGKITDETRIRAALPTLEFLLEKTDKIALASHLGRPKGQKNPKFSLEPVGHRLAEILGREVALVHDYLDTPPSQVFSSVRGAPIVLLENLRFHPGETSNDPEFARLLRSGFDAYVNDAFGTLHRAHASVVGVPGLMSPEERSAGRLVTREVEQLHRLNHRPASPYTVVMGGAKVADKIAVILNLMNHCNHILIGGAMAYTFLKFRGVDVGASRVEDDRLDMVESIYRSAETRKVSIHLPVDHVASEAFEENSKPIAIDSESIPSGLMGLDIGPKTRESYAKVIAASKTVLWNGPMGVFEWPGFAQGTLAVAKAMSTSSAVTIVGGGDSVAAVNQAQLADRMTHVSTGGGASLEFLEGKTLPGIKVLIDERVG